VQHTIVHTLETKGHGEPWLFLALFIAASFLMIWRLEVLSAKGFEGTVLGTLVMPYCTGLGNLIFAFIIGRNGGNGADVMTNSLVNNVTNMTLVLGLPAILWGMRVLPKKKPARKNVKVSVNLSLKKKPSAASKTYELNRLSLLLTLTAVLFFTGAVWALGHRGILTFDDGLVLVGLFLFWQCFHIFDVLKNNVRQGQSLGWTLPFDLAVLVIGAYGIYISTDWLVAWVNHSAPPHGFIKTHFGWVSGWIMVLPNAVLALYYSWRGQPETVYTSQVGDSHVSIPLCIGIYALYHPMVITPFFHVAMFILLAATLVHFFCVMLFGALPRAIGWLLVAAYVVFLCMGLLS
jgi:cation:H+ antiporter